VYLHSFRIGRENAGRGRRSCRDSSAFCPRCRIPCGRGFPSSLRRRASLLLGAARAPDLRKTGRSKVERWPRRRTSRSIASTCSRTFRKGLRRPSERSAGLLNGRKCPTERISRCHASFSSFRPPFPNERQVFCGVWVAGCEVGGVALFVPVPDATSGMISCTWASVMPRFFRSRLNRVSPT
jgi:hypothetical protein